MSRRFFYAVIEEIQRSQNDDIPFWEKPDIQGEQLSLFGDPEPLTSSKPAKEKPKSEFAKGPVVDGVQVYEALAAEIDRGTGFVHGKLRVQDFYEEQHPTIQQLADFLKKEYGTGGHSGEGKVKLVADEVDVPETEVTAPDKGENFTITDDALGEGGAKAKFRANVDAIKTLKTLEREKRPATAEEKETLSKYVGWGALAKAFDKDDPKWAAEYKELSELLTPQEYAQARSTVNDAFYPH